MKWEAQYNDGSALSQFDADSSGELIENKYSDIDRQKLQSFCLIQDNNTPLFVLHLEPGQKLIYRRRVQKTVGADEDFVVYLVGWQQTLFDAQGEPQSVQSIAYVTESGEIHLAGAWRDDHPWFYSIQHVPCEEEQI